MSNSILLNFKKYGEGSSSLLIVHGLFGSLDNWVTLAKRFSQNYTVYCVDLRNHGLSPHTDEFNIELLSEDLNTFIKTQIGSSPIVIGHSLGGKAVMHLAIHNPEVVKKLVIADIGPKAYSPHHQAILKSLNSLNFNTIRTRKEAEEIIFSQIQDFATTQFLTKNITRTDSNKLSWKFNLISLCKNISEVGKSQEGICTLNTLFLRAGRSNYILEIDIDSIRNQFPFSEIETIEDAGHWLHAEQPELFYNKVISFLKD